MSRLTEKYKGFYRKPDDAPDNWQNECVHKLGAYEDIEVWCERIRKGDPIYEKTNNGMIIYYDSYSAYDITYDFAKKRIGIRIGMYDYDFIDYFWIDEYGKTWAFTREELENVD